MTFIAEALQNIIGEGTAAAFAKKAGVSQSTMSRYLSGISLIEAPNLARLVNAAPDASQKAELVQAWIRDQIPGSLGKSIQVNIDPVGDTAARRRLPKLSPETEETLRYWWKEAAKDPHVGVTLAHLRAMRNC